jgi:hypothetical protein
MRCILPEEGIRSSRGPGPTERPQKCSRGSEGWPGVTPSGEAPWPRVPAPPRSGGWGGPKADNFPGSEDAICRPRGANRLEKPAAGVVPAVRSAAAKPPEGDGRLATALPTLDQSDSHTRCAARVHSTGRLAHEPWLVECLRDRQGRLPPPLLPQEPRCRWSPLGGRPCGQPGCESGPLLRAADPAASAVAAGMRFAAPWRRRPACRAGCCEQGLHSPLSDPSRPAHLSSLIYMENQCHANPQPTDFTRGSASARSRW